VLSLSPLPSHVGKTCPNNRIHFTPFLSLAMAMIWS
jgi:hypothetical protein